MTTSNSVRIANFVFVDIVGLSDDVIPSEKQAQKIELLNHFILGCPSFRKAIKEMSIPTGDGAVIGLEGIEDPLNLAIELHKRIRNHNEGKRIEDQIKVRIGINSGPVILVKDIKGNMNFWGDGIIIARRIMDYGNAEHILLSSWIATQLIRLRQEYRDCIHKTKTTSFKHRRKEVVYSAYSKDFGNPYPPNKKREISEHSYHYLEDALVIKNTKTMSAHHVSCYELFDPLDPITGATIPIGMHQPRTIEDMNIQAYDEDYQPLEFEVNVDMPTEKEIIVFFPQAVPKGKKAKIYFEYDSIESQRRYYLDYQQNIDKVVFKFEYPAGSDLNKPVFYKDINNKKIKLKRQPSEKQIGDVRRVSWEKNDLRREDTFLIEW